MKDSLTKALNVVLGALAICSLVGLLGHTFWFFDLFNHLRPQALIATFILLLTAIIFKKPVPVFLSLIILIFNLSLMTYRLYEFGMPVQTAQGTPLRVISANVLTSNNNHQAIIGILQKYDPDIFVAIEVNDKWIKALNSIEEKYPYTFKHSSEDNFGMAIYAKKPFNGEVLKLGDYQLPLLKLDFGSFTLMCAHPIPPVSNQNNTELNKYISEVAVLAQKEQKPVIVAGDLNTTLWSANIKPLIPSGLKPANKWGWAWTWPRLAPLFAIQIDHIFVKTLSVSDFKVLEGTGSDHFPVMATIILPDTLQ